MAVVADLALFLEHGEHRPDATHGAIVVAPAHPQGDGLEGLAPLSPKQLNDFRAVAVLVGGLVVVGFLLSLLRCLGVGRSVRGLGGRDVPGCEFRSGLFQWSTTRFVAVTLRR